MTRSGPSIRTLLLLTMATLAGCAHDPPSPSLAAPVPAPTTQPRTTPPLRYADYGDPDRLTPAQLDELTTLAAECCPPGRSLWFIRVLSNRTIDGRPTYAATLYFTPDRTSDRLRAGPCAYVEAPVEMRRELIKRYDPQHTYPALRRYVQVSPAPMPFKPNTLPIPSGADMPFKAPEQLSDPDLIAIIDAARQVEDARHPPEFRQPVLRITAIDDTFEVTFGQQIGPLSGGGTLVTVHRTPTGFRADPTIAIWRS